MKRSPTPRKDKIYQKKFSLHVITSADKKEQGNTKILWQIALCQLHYRAIFSKLEDDKT